MKVFKEETFRYVIRFIVTWDPNDAKAGGFCESIETRATGASLRVILRALRSDPRIAKVSVWKEVTTKKDWKVGIGSMRKGR